MDENNGSVSKCWYAPISIRMSVLLCCDRTCDEDEHEETEDGVKLREHSEHHRSTEGIVTATDS